MRTNLSIVRAGSACPLFTATLALAIALTLNACGKGGGDVKLLESITDDEGNVIERFEYDKQNRLVKTSTIAITYSGDNLVTVVKGTDTTKYAKKGNTITSGSDTITINGDGYIVAEEGKYKYDDKKSPFFNCNTPKWLLMREFGDSGYGAKNNIIEADGYVTSHYEYEYDSAGFATKQTVVEDCPDVCEEERTWTRHFIYPGRTAEEIAAFDAARLAAKKERAEAAAKKEAEQAAKVVAEKAAEKAAYEYAKAKKEKALKEGQTFTDKRDGKIYRTVKIGAQTWMAENLNYNAEGSVCYAYACYSCNIEGGECLLGRLYGGVECPSGFHLPTKDEWEALIAFVQSDKGCTDCAGKHLKAAGGWNSGGNGLDSYGFSALPGGRCYWLDGGNNCEGIGDYGYWSSEGTMSSNGTIFVMGGGNGVRVGQLWEVDNGMTSVRCIKDEDKTSAPEIETTR